MLSIQEFAKRCNTRPSTLRYYDERGILLPDWVDPDSGYRYYEEASVYTFFQIEQMQKAGFTLDEIRRHLEASDSLTDEEFYEQKIRAHREKLALCEALKREKTMESIRLRKEYCAPVAQHSELTKQELNMLAYPDETEQVTEK